MADNNNLEVFQEKFDEISEVLDSMRAQNSINSDVTQRILSNITLKLESLSDEENSDLIKIFLSELNKNLDEKHNFVSAKFSEIENSFNKIIEKTGENIKTEEMRQIFEIIATNINAFSKEVFSQKDILTEIVQQIDEFKKDDSSKTDILKNISVLKVELEKFNNGFQSIILNLNDNFKSVVQEVLKIDTTDAIAAVKKDIENIYLSSNAVLSTLQIIDRKNSEFEDFMSGLVTKEEFKLEREQVASLIEQNTRLIDYINLLPKKESVDDLTEKVSSSINIINALKNVLTETGKQNQQMLTAQLDNLESKILNISTEEEFIGFRKELSEFATGIIESTNHMREDLAQTSTGIKDLAKFLTSMDIKNTFENFGNLAKVSEENLKGSISDLSGNISKEVEKNRAIIKTDINAGVDSLTDKINSAKEEITENSKSNLSSIMEYVQSVINNIFSLKNTIQVENAEQMEVIETKFQSLKDNFRENVNSSSNTVIQNSKENLESIISNFEKVFQEITLAKDNMDETSEHQSKVIETAVNEISKRIVELKSDLNQNSQENFANMVSIVDDFSQKFSEIRSSLESSAELKNQEIQNNIKALLSKLTALKEDLISSSEHNTKSLLNEISAKFISVEESMTNNSEMITAGVQSSIEDLIQATTSVDEKVEQAAGIRFGWIKSNLEEIAKETKRMQINSDLKNEASLEKIISLFQAVSAEYAENKNFFSETIQTNFEELSNFIKGLNTQIEDENNVLKTDFAEKASEITNLLSSLPSLIEENQNKIEAENKMLIEQNSKSIDELIEKIQSLTQGVMVKDNPFKQDVISKFSSLRELLAELKEDLANTEEKFEEKISSAIQHLENSVQQMSSGYDTSLISLQNRLLEYLNNIQQITETSDLKLEGSIKEISDIKSEIQAILESLSILNDDGKVKDLASSISEKFEEVLENISHFEEKSTLNNKENIQKLLSLTEVQVDKIQQQLDEHRALLSESSKSVSSEIEEKISSLKEHIDLANTDVLNVLAEKTELIVSEFEPIRAILDELSSIDFENIVSEIKSELENSQFTILASIKESMKGESEGLCEKLEDAFSEINCSLVNFNSEQKAQSSQNIEELKEALARISQGVEHIIKSSDERAEEEELLTRLNLLEGNFSQKYEEIKSGIDSGFEGNSALVQSTLDELISVKSDLLSEINNTKAYFTEENSNQLLNIKQELQDIIDEINKAQEEASSYKLNLSELLKVQDEEIKSQLSEVENIIVDELSQNIDTFKKALQLSTEQIVEKISMSEENYSNSIVSMLSEVKSNFYQKVEDNLDDIKSFIEVMENNRDYNSIIEELKSDVFEKFSILADDIEESVSSISLKSEFGDLADRVKDSTSALLEDLHDRFLIALDDNKLSQEVLSKSEEIERRIEDLKNIVSNDISESLEKFGLDIEKQSNDFSNLLSEIKVSLAELKESYIDLSLNSSMEISGLLGGIQEKIDSLNEKLDSLEFENVIEVANDKILKSLELINKNVLSVAQGNSISENFEQINSKLDLIVQAPSENNFSQSLEEIKEIISDNNSLLENLKGLEKLNQLSGAQDEIKNILQKFEDKLEPLKEVSPFDEIEANSIKDELKAIKTDIIENLLNVFQQISFVVEAEEIKDFVEEKSDEIKETIKSSLGNNFNNILSSLDELNEKTAGVDGTCYDIKKEISEVRKHLQLMQNYTGDEDSEYSYTLQDVESDIAKVRMILNDLSKSKPESDLDKLNEDILSISTRTNKLLLNSDESYNALKENLSEFRSIVFQLDEKMRYLDNSESNKRVENKLESLNTLLLSSVQSDKTFNQAFMYLAEWVDTASENLRAIEEKVEKNSESFEKQQKKIDSIEAKLDKILKILSEPEAKTDAKLVKKVDSIEKQLVALGKNVEKLTSYVD